MSEASRDGGNAGSVVDPIVREAIDRFKYCLERYGTARDRFIQDLKFDAADSYNRYQWPGDELTSRDQDDRPTLTINKARQHNLKIINDAKQNKPSIVYKGTGGGGTYDAAQIWMGVARHIEYQSNAQAAYDIATGFQVRAGWGWWRVDTDYADEETFDQEIYIRAINDPLSVLGDPDAQEPDKLDRNYAFVFTQIAKDIFERDYPEAARDHAGQTALGETDWITRDHVRKAEYWRVVEKEDTLYLTAQGPMLGSKMGPELEALFKADKTIRRRPTKRRQVEWYLIVGSTIIDKRLDYPGRYIPLMQIIGEESTINGIYDCHGHTRALLDAQRMYNWMSSAAVEFAALQDKIPWTAPVEAIDGFEDIWNNANKHNFAFLPYRAFHKDNPEIQLPKPERPQPPTPAQAFITGMQVAMNEMMMVSGQYESNMGEKGNERTGVAIQYRQRQGDNATYHYIDQLAIGIRGTGKIILDLAPHIYDRPGRVLQIMAVDGSTMEVEIDPQQQQAAAVEYKKMQLGAKQFFNPNVGRFWVEADVGPGYATRRERAFDALVLMLTQSKELVPLIGDLMMQMGDFPLSDEAAARMKRMVPPAALGVGPTPAEQQLLGENQTLKASIGDLLDQVGQLKIQLKGKDDKHVIDRYIAETGRIDVLSKAVGEGDKLKILLMQAINDAIETHIQSQEEPKDDK